MTRLAEFAMLAQGWRRFLLLFVAGAIGGLSVPPFYFLPALFVSMPIWVWALDGAERLPGWRRLFGPAFRIGFAYGLGYFLVALHWLGAAFFVEGGIMLVVMPFAILALAGLVALFWGLASALAHLLWSPGAWRIVTLSTFLTLAEWARGHFFSGFPFDLLGYALAANDEMSQLASVIGVYGLTALAALLAMTPALIWPPDQRGLARRLTPFFLSLVVIVAQLAYGHQRLASTVVAPRTDMRMRVVQPMVLEHADWSEAKPADIITKLIDLSNTRLNPADPGLSTVTQLVWPESSLPFFLSDYPEALARIGQILPPNGVLLTGAPREQYDPTADRLDPANRPAFNSLIAVNKQGEIVSSYDKSHLVPFGEYLPFPTLFAAIGLRQFVPGIDGWQAGDGRRLMQVPNTPAFLALICYEAIFSGDLGPDTGKAQFILNITNDAWFDGSIGLAQHADHVRLRAVEEGLPIIRVANSGLTEAIDPLGRVTQRLAPEQIGVLDIVPANRLPETIFTRLGYWPLLGALLLGLAIAAWSARRRSGG
ncbi:MAG: apolipoprotein N-acyltransferase [Devosia sp.]|nr:apolipoprotein N-acyltransferase [Devosia sp.]